MSDKLTNAHADTMESVLMHYPLWPGDTVSHQAAKDLSEWGWIVRDADGNWIPTAIGVAAACGANCQKFPKDPPR